jgi:uroporphyrinogen decarboxylase
MQPLRRFDLDAAILFSDILVVPHALGQELSFVEGEGPRLGPRVTPDFSSFESKLEPVYEALRLLRRELPSDKALLGFAGAPFTLACYMIDGQGDGVFAKAVEMSKSGAPEFEALIDLLTDAVARHLIAQIEAGADAVQLFDSWAGLADEQVFRKWVTIPARRIVAAIHAAHPGFPVIGFPRGAGKFYPPYAEKTGIAGISIDQYTTLEWAADVIPANVCLQGNLDPETLVRGGEALRTETLRILQAAEGRPFIFNLGHGILKETPPEHVSELAAIIRAFDAK